MTPKWRAVYCKPRQEARAHLHLLNQDYHAYLPQVRTRKRLRGRDRSVVEPMFPRYLFIQLEDFAEDFGPIRSTRGVVGLVKLGDEVPTVPDALVTELRQRQDGDGAIDLTAFDRLKPNDPVEITAGPFAGYQGIFDADNGEQRAIVLLELLNAQRRVEVPASDLKRA
jgi:transcriptional antiterminator RfaH